MKRMLATLIIFLTAGYQNIAYSDPAKPEKKAAEFSFQKGADKLPTYIKSDSLTLKSQERIFTYTGNVEVKQGDMTLTSDVLDGKYDENNKIQQLVARQNVVILKGDNIRAHGERATYVTASDTVEITENPELQQNGSVLTADLIRIFLKENRSTAEGAVRVKLVNDDKAAGADGKKSGDLKSMLKK